MANDSIDDAEPGPASWINAVQLAALTSIGAGAIHAAAVGIHAEHPTVSRLFVLVAAAQLGAGVVMLVRSARATAGAIVIVNAGAVIAWVLTRTTGISWIEGLEAAEK